MSDAAAHDPDHGRAGQRRHDPHGGHENHAAHARRGGRGTHQHEHPGHGGHGHTHEISADADRRYLSIALGLLVAFMSAEVTAAVIAHSLALLSDAAHMLTDAGAIGLSLVALRLAARPAQGAMTFGLKRAEILSAQLNGATLAVLGLWIVYEAIHRLISAPTVDGPIVLIVALAGAAVNLAATWALSRANRENLAVQGSFQHVLTDLYAFAATAVAAGVIIATGFNRADGIASLGVAASMLYAAYGLLRDSGRILLESAPPGVSVAELGCAMLNDAAVCEVHDLHVWEINPGFPALAAHVLVAPDQDCHAARQRLASMLTDRYEIKHITLQLEHQPAPLITLTARPEPQPA
jgi:cobalt-zinc-cadmium efflux system protein